MFDIRALGVEDDFDAGVFAGSDPDRSKKITPDVKQLRTSIPWVFRHADCSPPPLTERRRNMIAWKPPFAPFDRVVVTHGPMSGYAGTVIDSPVPRLLTVAVDQLDGKTRNVPDTDVALCESDANLYKKSAVSAAQYLSPREPT